MRKRVTHSVSLRDAFEDYRLAIGPLSADYRRWVGQKLGVFAGWCEAEGHTHLGEMTTAHLRHFMAWLEAHPPVGRKISSYTLHGYRQVITVFFGWCKAEGLLDADVSARVERIRVDVKMIQTFTPQQVDQLMRAAGQSEHPYRDRAILAVLLDTGVRAQELCRLTLDETHLTGDDCFIQVTGKGRKQRQVGLGPQARLALSRYLTRERHSTGPYVFVINGGTPFKVRGLESFFDRLRRATQMTGVRCSPHDCRHTFAVNYLRAGGNLYTLSRLLGHSTVGVTEHYLRSLNQIDARQGGISVLDNLWK